MKLRQLISPLDILCSTVSEDIEISSICCDSRTAEPGCLFIAFSGYVFDGNNYVSMAFNKGAVAVVCERVPDIDVPYVLVPNGRIAMAKICDVWFGHPSGELCVIGITGTNGKTTISYLIKSILEQTGAKVGLIGTIQNMIGNQSFESVDTTPESYQLQELLRRMVSEGCKYVVMEVCSHSLALHWVDSTEYSVGIFTNLTEDHLDFHKTMEAYGDAKALLFERCRISVLNQDDPAWEKMRAHAAGKVVTYSIRNEKADLFADNTQLKSDGVEMDVHHSDEVYHMEMGIPGIFSVYNSLAAILGVMSLGFELRESAALHNIKGVKGRVEVVPTPGQDFTVIIDYAHSPDALENLLRTVRDFAKGRVIVVFGCGGDKDPFKRPLMGEIAAHLSDFAVVTTDNPRTEDPMSIIRDILKGMKNTQTPYIVIENRREAILWAMTHAGKDDIVVLAGKGHETYQIVGRKRIHFDEREIVAECLKCMENRYNG